MNYKNNGMCQSRGWKGSKLVKFNTNPIVKRWPVSDKRSSTGNLCYFTDQFDNHPWENPELNQTLRSTVSDHYFLAHFPQTSSSIQFSFIWTGSCGSTMGRLWFCRLVCKKSKSDVQARRRKSSEKGEVGEEGDEEEEGRDPATTLQAMAGTGGLFLSTLPDVQLSFSNRFTIFELVCLLSDWTRAFNPFIYVWLKCDLWKSTVICSDQSTISGNVGKELNQLISMMNNEDGGEGESWRITFMFNILFHYHNLFFYLVVIFDWVNFWCIPSMKQLFEIQHLTNPISLIIF